MVYDISEYSGGQHSLFTKQISDFPVRRIRYLDDKNPNLLVSCGRSNICFWQMKNKFLTMQAINLNEHAADNIFIQIDVLRQKTGKPSIETGDKGKQNYFVYVGSSKGFLYLIDYSQGEMKSVLRLHNVKSIHSELTEHCENLTEPQLYRHWRSRQLRAHLVSRLIRTAV